MHDRNLDLQMRAMAILYIGPHRNPDFQSDYQLSPILAPDRLLARFPPLLMTCGEKDPFVDDTLIFAGRVREAKRARRAELERIIAGKSSQFGEQLRMSVHEAPGYDQSVMRALRRERERLAAETEDDWVRMVIFSEWSHGYLQMPSLMREARGVINDLADWIDEAFSKDDSAAAAREASGIAAPAEPALAGLRSRRYSRTTREREPLPDTDGFTSASTTSAASETELDTDEVLTFAPKRRSPPNSYADMRRNSLASNGTVRRASMGASSQPSSFKGQSPPREVNRRSGGEMRSDILHEVPLPSPSPRGDSSPSGSKRPANGNGGSPTGNVSTAVNGTPTKSGQSGQTITESELMRRRRLLDSHLISQSQDSVK